MRYTGSTQTNALVRLECSTARALTTDAPSEWPSHDPVGGEVAKETGKVAHKIGGGVSRFRSAGPTMAAQVDGAHSVPLAKLPNLPDRVVRVVGKPVDEEDGGFAGAFVRIEAPTAPRWTKAMGYANRNPL
jgi:hypothetical protein